MRIDIDLICFTNQGYVHLVLIHRKGPPLFYFSLFDGHGGSDAVNFAAAEFQHHIALDSSIPLERRLASIIESFL